MVRTTVVWLVGGWVALAAAGTRSAHAQADPCRGRGTRPDGSCRDVAPLHEPPAPTGVELTSEPPGAEVRREDGVFLGTTPLRLDSLKLSVGEHSVSLKRDDYEPTTQPVRVSGGRMSHLHFSLVRLPRVTLVPADDEARNGVVTIDDKVVGSLPVMDQPISPGNHVIDVQKDDHEPWQRMIQIASGATGQTIAVELQPKTGMLLVGRAGPRALQGAKVYLDPDSISNPSGDPLGTTPLAVPVKAGKYLVVLHFDNLPPISAIVKVPADGEGIVPAVLPVLESPRPRDQRALNMNMAERFCAGDSNDSEIKGDACVVLGHVMAHPADGTFPDLPKAEAYYRRGCDAQNATACFALGYLQQQRNLHQDKSARNLFLLACKNEQPVMNACWAYYAMRIQDIPDPTLDSGERAQFRRGLSMGLDFTLGHGPTDGGIWNIESGMSAEFGITDRLTLIGRLYFQLRYFTQRASPINEIENDQSDLGLGTELGIALRPQTKSNITLRLAGRLAGRALADPDVGDTGRRIEPKFGAVAAAAYSVGSSDIEIGVLLDQIPLTIDYIVVGGVQQHWRPIVMVSWRPMRVPLF